MQPNISQQLHKVLQDKFQFQNFRPGQLEAITLLMEHGQLLCIQPTGYGKSLLYQLPAMLLNGITLVISPLLALMRDQITQLQNRFNIPAASINTDQNEEENIAAKQAAIMGNIRILFVAPEQLDHVDKFNFLLRLPIQLLVVDEAHCISTWGHDFRPSYRQIIQLAQALVGKNPELKLLGLTATANSTTEVDIKQQLTMMGKELFVHRESMNRPNIRLTVVPTANMAVKLATLNELLQTLTGCGLIYCATRENTELTAEFLREQGVNAVAYHAGIDAQFKRSIQNDFLHDKYPVITATNALGMGIDKSNLRFIIHFDFPGSITAYYQEVGRCGRDGLPADGILFYDPADSKIQKHFIDSAQPSHSDFSAVLNAVENAEFPPNLLALKRSTGMHPTKLTVVVAELIEQNFLTKTSRNGSQIYLINKRSGRPDLTRYITQFEMKNAELKTMQRYAEQVKKCLMTTLRTALGDKESHACGQCSGCAPALFKSVIDKDIVITISSWLDRRTVSINLSKKIKNTASGIAVLDGKLRSDDFVNFMRNRATSSISQLGITDTLMELIKACLRDLTKHYKFSCIVPVPSRTWGARDYLAMLLGNYLQLPVMPGLLSWHESAACSAR